MTGGPLAPPPHPPPICKHVVRVCLGKEVKTQGPDKELAACTAKEQQTGGYGRRTEGPGTRGLVDHDGTGGPQEQGLARPKKMDKRSRPEKKNYHK